MDSADAAAANVAAIVLEETQGVGAGDHAVVAGVVHGQPQDAVAVHLHQTSQIMGQNDHVPGVIRQANLGDVGVGIEPERAVVNVETLLNVVPHVEQPPPAIDRIQPEENGRGIDLVREDAQSRLKLQSGVPREIQHPPRRTPDRRRREVQTGINVGEVRWRADGGRVTILQAVEHMRHHGDEVRGDGRVAVHHQRRRVAGAGNRARPVAPDEAKVVAGGEGDGGVGRVVEVRDARWPGGDGAAAGGSNRDVQRVECAGIRGLAGFGSVAVGALVHAEAVVVRLVGEQEGRIAGVDTGRVGGVCKPEAVVVGTRRGGEMEIVVPAVETAQRVVATVRVHKEGIGAEAVGVESSGRLPRSQVGARPGPISQGGAIRSVEVVVVTDGRAVGAVMVDGVVTRAPGPNDVVTGDGTPRTPAVVAVATIERVVFDHIVVVSNADVPVALVAAVIVVNEVVLNLVAAAGDPQAVAAIGIDHVTAEGGTGSHQHAVAAVQVHPVPHGLRCGAAEAKGVFAGVLVKQVVVGANPVLAIESAVVVVVAVVATGQEIAVEIKAPAGIVVHAVARGRANAAVQIQAVPVVARNTAGDHDIGARAEGNAPLVVAVNLATDQFKTLGSSAGDTMLGAGHFQIFETHVAVAVQVEAIHALAGVVAVEHRTQRVRAADQADELARRAGVGKHQVAVERP